MKVAKKILNNKMAMIGLFIVSIIVFFGLFGPMIASHDPMEMDLYNIGAAPNDEHIWGTDEMGRDIFSRVIVGARTSLIIGVAVVFIGCGAGILIGMVCGYFGGILDGVVMKVMDVLMAFPTILLSLFFITILGIGTVPAVIGVGLATIPRFARLVRSSVLSIKEKEYFEAEKAVGQSDILIMLKHVLPNCIGPIIVQVTLTMGNSIISVAGLGFLGLGADPGIAEWGAMLNDARNCLRTMPQIATFPGLAIAFTVLGFNLLGDGLRDILDVRQD